jgi:hypothetical protein
VDGADLQQHAAVQAAAERTVEMLDPGLVIGVGPASLGLDGIQGSQVAFVVRRAADEDVVAASVQHVGAGAAGCT